MPDSSRTSSAGLNQVAERMREEQNLLGDVAKQQAFADQYKSLRRHHRARISASSSPPWRGALNQLRIRLPTAEKPRYSRAAGPRPRRPRRSPRSSKRFATRRSSTRERPQTPPAPGADPKAAPEDQEHHAPKIDLPARRAGCNREAAFRPYQQLTKARAASAEPTSC